MIESAKQGLLSRLEYLVRIEKYQIVLLSNRFMSEEGNVYDVAKISRRITDNMCTPQPDSPGSGLRIKSNRLKNIKKRRGN